MFTRYHVLGFFSHKKITTCKGCFCHIVILYCAIMSCTVKLTKPNLNWLGCLIWFCRRKTRTIVFKGQGHTFCPTGLILYCGHCSCYSPHKSRKWKIHHPNHCLGHQRSKSLGSQDHGLSCLSSIRLLVCLSCFAFAGTICILGNTAGFLPPTMKQLSVISLMMHLLIVVDKKSTSQKTTNVINVENWIDSSLQV